MLRIVLLTALVALASGFPQTKQAPRLDGRIVGGEQVTIEEYPFQISMLYHGSHRCGGTIIDKNIIVTAAHCTDGLTASNLNIRAGSSDRTSGGVVAKVAAIHQHPKYDAWDIDYDISILVLEEDLPMSDKIVAFWLAPEEPKENVEVVCTGWGTLSEGGSLPSALYAVTVGIVNRESCKQSYKGYLISDRMICAGVEEGGKDACQGDSGGPLFNDNGLVGVVSWGMGCGRRGYPGVYSNVDNLRDFIKDVTGMTRL